MAVRKGDDCRAGCGGRPVLRGLCAECSEDALIEIESDAAALRARVAELEAALNGTEDLVLVSNDLVEDLASLPKTAAKFSYTTEVFDREQSEIVRKLNTLRGELADRMQARALLAGKATEPRASAQDEKGGG